LGPSYLYALGATYFWDIRTNPGMYLPGTGHRGPGTRLDRKGFFTVGRDDDRKRREGKTRDRTVVHWEEESEMERAARRSYLTKRGIQGEADLLTLAHGDVFDPKSRERAFFLGSIRERVIRVLTFDQVRADETFSEIQEALDLPEAKHLLISGEAHFGDYYRYIEMAKDAGVDFEVVESGKSRGEVALAVVSDDAVEIDGITVGDALEEGPH